MPKSLVGRIKNKKFAYFWLLIGGSVGNILIALYSPQAWPLYLAPAIFSIIMTIVIADKVQRPKIWFGIDLLLALIPVSLVNFTISLPSILIVFGCVLGIMNW